MLNPRSPIPLYRQLAETLTALIDQGHYQPGARIPSEPKLAAAYGIGRPTVRQAIDTLVRKGRLIRQRGSGTYVSEPRQEVDLFSLDGTGASFRKKGVTVATRIITPICITLVKTNGGERNPFNGREAYFLSRLTEVDASPVLLEHIYLHDNLFKGIDRIDLEGRSLSTVADEVYYLKPDRGKQNFSIGYPDEERAGLLDVKPGVPILVVRRSLHFDQVENGVYAELWCRTDKFVFSQHIGGITNG